MLPRSTIAEFCSIVGTDGVFTDDEQVRTYESDGLASYRQKPELVVLPRTTEQVRDVVRLCNREGIPFVPRGSGTGLSGGALPVSSSSPGCALSSLWTWQTSALWSSPVLSISR
jgi:glycolate oxidase